MCVYMSLIEAKTVTNTYLYSVDVVLLYVIHFDVHVHVLEHCT